jgi:type IV pilus assembly protein PilA
LYNLKERGMSMIKKFNNRKGFTLIELLIVIAILGVLAVIAFGTFTSLLGGTREKADKQTATVLEDQIELMITETGILNFSGTDKFQVAVATNATVATDTTAFVNSSGNEVNLVAGDDIYMDASTNAGYALNNLICAMQTGFNFTHRGETNEYGPYLEIKDEVKAETYIEPQFNGAVGGENVGYRVEVSTRTGDVTVKPATTTIDGKDASGNSVAAGTGIMEGLYFVP